MKLFAQKVAALLVMTAVLTLSSFSPTPAAHSESFFDESGKIGRRLDMVLGETKVLPVSNPKRVAIGDPAVADIADASAIEILIAAKKDGETNLQLWDDYGQREILIRVFKEDLGFLKKRLEDLFATAGIRGVSFKVGVQERKIFVLGDLPVRKKEVATQLLGNFTDKIINLLTFSEDNPLVEIDVQILEIAKTAIDKLGIDWATSALVFNETSPVGDHKLLTRLIPDMLKAVGQSRFDRTTLNATLRLLEQDNMARVLSRPKLVALSGKEAKFLVGGQVPILSEVSVSSGTTTTSVQYVDYGIKLNISPEVKETGDILCRIEVEVKSIDTTTALTVQTGSAVSTSTPGFKTRNASTELYLKNDQTIFMAGLISNEEANNLNQVPAIGDIPIIGALFRSKQFSIGATELVISITPRILNYGDMRRDIEQAAISKRAGEDADPTDVYIQAVQDRILKNVSYPLEAQRANLAGTVVISLHLLSNGQLVEVVMDKTSGHKLLDNAAVYSVRRLAPYPAFPKGLLLKEIWVEVPITYQTA